MRVSWPMFLGPNLNRDLTQLIEFKWNEKHYIGMIAVCITKRVRI